MPASSSSSLWGPAAKHAVLCVAAPAWIAAFCVATGSVNLRRLAAPWEPLPGDPDPWTEYGVLATVILIAARLVSFLGMPQVLFNLYGLLRFNAFPPDVRLRGSPLLAPLVCVRVVTRGVYKALVRETVRKNMATLARAGVENFAFQVVTDEPIGLVEYDAAAFGRVDEIVVPSSYQTKSGAKFKARALQYCLEDEVNRLSDDDWIVHLDEETLLTENSVRGILNFVSDGRHDFGQGLVTYASSKTAFKSRLQAFQYRICTVADSFRVADDMGKLRCQFKVFHKPIFGFKGSYVVTRLGAERRVSFDNGEEGSIAEDCFFAMLAMDSMNDGEGDDDSKTTTKQKRRRHTFDFIEGEMLEKSPFWFYEFFKQRERWMKGITMVVLSSRISWRTKGLLAMSTAAWLTLPVSTLNLYLSQRFPFSLGILLDFGLGFLGATGLLSYGYGYLKQHQVRRYSWPRLLLVAPEIVLSTALSIVVENCAVFAMWFGRWDQFYIVQKETDGMVDGGGGNDEDEAEEKDPAAPAAVVVEEV